MDRKAVLFLVAVMTAGSAVSAKVQTFADIMMCLGGAQAYINSVYAKRPYGRRHHEDGERVFRANDDISYNETVQLVYALCKKRSAETINKMGRDNEIQ